MPSILPQPQPQPHLRRGSVAYWMASVAQNQGHAGHAVGLVLRVMTDELGLHRAEAFTSLENLPSQPVLRRNGFSSYGVAHSSIFLDGSWRDGLLWERGLGAGQSENSSSTVQHHAGSGRYDGMTALESRRQPNSSSWVRAAES